MSEKRKKKNDLVDSLVTQKIVEVQILKLKGESKCQKF